MEGALRELLFSEADFSSLNASVNVDGASTKQLTFGSARTLLVLNR